MPKSLIEYAYDCMSNQAEPISFADLWKYVKENAGLTDEEAGSKVSRFYTNLILDGRFVTLGENSWDLRVRHTFDKVHIDMQDVYADVDQSTDDDIEDTEEEKEYNEAFESNESKQAGDDEALAPETSDDEEEETL